MASGSCPSTLPPVSSDYLPVGTYKITAGVKTYFTGPSITERAIVVIYDVFGFHNSTIQGADRLAQETGSLVILPDLFNGNPLPLDVFPPDTDEKKQIISDFRSFASPSMHAPTIVKIVEEVTSQTGITTWAAFGLCFGGMVTALMSADGTIFKAAGTAHPGRPNPDQARAIAIPYICLFSKEDGDPAIIEEYGDIVSKKPGSVVRHFPDMHHGWMAARADLANEANARDFQEGWKLVADFFNTTLL